MLITRFFSCGMAIAMLLPLDLQCGGPTEEVIDVPRQMSSFFAETDYGKCAQMVEGWRRRGLDERVMVARALAGKLRSRRASPLTVLNDMVVRHRLVLGDNRRIGEMLSQDLYIEGGRAAWAIGRLLHLHRAVEMLPPIREDLDDRALEERAAVISIVVDAYIQGLQDASAARRE